jgi:hypothetical protein
MVHKDHLLNNSWKVAAIYLPGIIFSILELLCYSFASSRLKRIHRHNNAEQFPTFPWSVFLSDDASKNENKEIRHTGPCCSGSR